MKYFQPIDLKTAPSASSFKIEQAADAAAIDSILSTGKVIKDKVDGVLSDEQAAAELAEKTQLPTTSRLDTIVKNTGTEGEINTNTVSILKLLAAIAGTLRQASDQSLLTSADVADIKTAVEMVRDQIGDSKLSDNVSELNKSIETIVDIITLLTNNKNIDGSSIDSVIDSVTELKKTVDDKNLSGTLSDDEQNSTASDFEGDEQNPTMSDLSFEPSESVSSETIVDGTTTSEIARTNTKELIEALQVRYNALKLTPNKPKKMATRMGSVQRMLNGPKPNTDLIKQRLDEFDQMIIDAQNKLDDAQDDNSVSGSATNSSGQKSDRVEFPTGNASGNAQKRSETFSNTSISNGISTDDIKLARDSLKSVPKNMTMNELLAFNTMLASDSSSSVADSGSSVIDVSKALDNLMQAKQAQSLATALPDDKKRIDRDTKKSAANAERVRQRIAEHKKASKVKRGKGVVGGKGVSATSSMSPDGWFGNLLIDTEALANRRLEAFDNGKHIISRNVTPDFVNLLTKTYSVKNVYTERSWKLYARLLALSDIPISDKNQKFKRVKATVDAIRDKNAAKKVKKTVDRNALRAFPVARNSTLVKVLTPDQVKEQLEVVNGTIASGNNNPQLLELKSELESAASKL
jgi:hypothetical protein